MRYFHVTMMSLALMLSATVSAQEAANDSTAVQQTVAVTADLPAADKQDKAAQKEKAKQEKAAQKEKEKQEKAALKAKAKQEKARQKAKGASGKSSAKGQKDLSKVRVGKAPSVKTTDVKLGNLLGKPIAKQGTPEYEAQRRAVVIAMDSIIKYAGRKELAKKYFGETPGVLELMRFSDLVCQKFNWDPVLMDSIAAGYYNLYGNEIYGKRRFAQLKTMYPHFVDAYYTEGMLYHTLAWQNSDGISFDPTWLALAKAQIDSAKQIVPDSPEPYMRWIRWQGKYAPKEVMPEADTLKMRQPNFPAYLKTGEMLGIFADNDRSYMPVTRELYHRADSLERDSMILANFQYYSGLCYTIGSSQKLKEDFMEGIDAANHGLEKFPNNPLLLRMKLWNSGYLPTVPARTIDGQRVPQLTAEEKTAAWDSAYVVLQQFEALPDSFKRNAIDYRWMGQINYELKHYADAVKYYKKQIAAGITDSTQYVTALLNIINSNRFLSNYEDAINTFAQLEKYKAEHEMEMDASDYNAITHVYRLVLGDSLETREYRMEAYEKMDSLCLIAATQSPENAYVFELRILEYMFNYLQVKLGKIDVTDESFKKIAQDVIDVEKAYQSTLDPLSIPHINTFILFYAYRQLLIHYFYYNDKTSSDYDEKMQMAYNISETMLEMPLAMELTELSQGQQNIYTSFMTFAEEANSALQGKYGKRRR